MPTPYPGVETAAQAPSTRPRWKYKPIGALPIDTDPPNGATFEQAYKVCLDNLAWINDPLAILGDYADAIWAVQNARNQHRGGFDHRGFPAGRFWSIDEDWIGLQTVNTGINPKGDIPRWTIYSNTVNGAIGCSAPDGAPFVSPTLSLNHNTGAMNDKVEVYATVPHLWPTDDTDTATSFDVRLFAANPADVASWVGIADNGSVRINSLLTGAWFAKIPGAANWRAYTGDGAAAAFTDTLVPSDTAIHHMRIEMTGANTSDDGTARVVFFIDGAVVANRTANLPFGAGAALGFRAGSMVTTGAAGGQLTQIGPLRHRQQEWDGDRFP